MKRFSRWCRRQVGAAVDWLASALDLEPQKFDAVDGFLKFAYLAGMSRKGFIALVERRAGPRTEAMRAYCVCVESGLFIHGEAKADEIEREMAIVLGHDMSFRECRELNEELLALARRVEIENRWPWLRRAAAAT